MNLTSYNNFFKSVLDFNAAIGFDKSHVRFPKTVSLYRELTLDEIQETIDGIDTNNDAEILDGVFDVFVTASYLNYLSTGISEAKNSPFSGGPKYTLNEMRQFLEDVRDLVEVHYVSHLDILILIAMAEQLYGYENVAHAFRDGIASNNSKFIFDTSKENREKELVYVNEKYAGTKYTDIKLVKSKFGKTPIYVARANHGEGKMLKPSTFIELDVSKYIK